MKTIINNLQQALSFQLEGFYELVKKSQQELAKTTPHISDPTTKELLVAYDETLGEQRIKLKRIFGYLLCGPFSKKSGEDGSPVVGFKAINHLAQDPSLRVVLITAAMHATSHYKIITLKEASSIALRLELNNVVGLLNEMIEGEEAAAQDMHKYFLKQLGKATTLSPVI